MILGSQGERLGVSHGLKTLINCLWESTVIIYQSPFTLDNQKEFARIEREKKKKKTNHT